MLEQETNCVEKKLKKSGFQSHFFCQNKLWKRKTKLWQLEENRG